ncbi:hypothetical protein BDFB_001282 [Asbolus verrucosus]|uniref:Uncharacterized protein n=1 Tax=Asbolus verrucosus TaxID=1661398 RepID=A0A482W2Z3_ASBVE|nr:hypothetical protein BDFB_001282 [Asbolus verrucosus]
MPKEPEDDFRYVETSVFPKNAK